MKTLSAKAIISGLTLIEVLVVIVVLAILVAVLLPNFARTKSTSDRRMFPCIANQKEIAMALFIFSGDNNGQFPWQLSATNGGSLESIANGHVFPHFQPLSQAFANQTKLFICPNDEDKHVAINYA